MEDLPGGWKKELSDHKNLILLSLVFLIVAVILNAVAGSYVEKTTTVSVPDLLLDNIPTFDLSLLFIYGYILVIAVYFTYPCFFKLKDIHIVISHFSLLVLIRSFSISLTHLGLPTDGLIYSSPVWFDFLDFRNAFFFSGHTAIPFLGFLLFRKEKIRIFFLLATIILASTVLLMHVHYSIDVFAALFITYGSYKIGNWLFGKIND